MTSESTAPSREQLLFYLQEAAEIEHNLMCCYLYAAFSLKRSDPRWTAAQAAHVVEWRRIVVSVALEEMSHLCLVGNLINALGGQAHFQHPAFPIQAGPYPADFAIRLQAFSPATIEHFVYLERPHGSELHDGAGYVSEHPYSRGGSPSQRLSPSAKDYETVGDLYAVLRAGLVAFAEAQGEPALFIGKPARQVDAQLAPLPGVCTVTDLASALRALDTIVLQGEGAGSENSDSHFCRFKRLATTLHAALAEDPTFEPAWNAATSPVMNAPPTPAGKVHVTNPTVVPWLDIGNALYAVSLRCMAQGFDEVERGTKSAWLSVGFSLMRAMTPLGQALCSRPASLEDGATNAGLTFTPLRTLAALPSSSAALFVSARLGELRDRAEALPLDETTPEETTSWRAVIAALGREQARLASLAGIDAPVAAETAPAALPAQTAPVAAETVDVIRGKSLAIVYRGSRCIHSRHCVLDAPTVFKANTPGEWIFPDNVPTEELVAVAHECPSGAIRYERVGEGPAEAAPPVNNLRLRENGPYAVHAPLTIAGTEDGFRATLCRCGQSKRKPYCDGSHVAAAFVASGEPPTGSVDPLAVRSGGLSVEPLRDGPLHVTGNLEICAGTGRTVARTTDARLCRCGQSRNKPFCDLSHVAAGFRADGS